MIALAEAIDAYLAEIGPCFHPDTQRSRAFWLAAFVRFCGETGVPAAVELRHVEAFQEWLLWTPGRRGSLYAPNSVDQAMRMVRAFLRWAAAHGYLPQNPTLGLVLVEPLARPVPQLSPEEIARVLQLASGPLPMQLRDRALLELIVETGLLPPRCAALDVAHVDLAGAMLYPPSGRWQSLGRGLLEALELYLRFGRPCLCTRTDLDALFLSQPGQRLNTDGIRHLVQRYGERAGLGTPLSPRTLAYSGKALDREFHRRHFSGDHSQKGPGSLC